VKQEIEPEKLSAAEQELLINELLEPAERAFARLQELTGERKAAHV
jgi:hypothetical protein